MSFNVSAPTTLSIVLNVDGPQAERSIATFFLAVVTSLATNSSLTGPCKIAKL